MSAGLGVTGNAAMESAISAGVRSLIGKSSVALVNNQGDLAATLKELGSSSNLRSLATNMVTAGLVTQVTNTLEVPKILPGATVAENMAVAARRGVIEASIRVGAEASIGGAEIDQALVSSFKSAAVDAVGSVAASEIGRAARAGEIGKASQLIAHAALGCGVGAAVQQDCAGGAAGAVTAEVVADWTQGKLMVLTAKDSSSWTPEDVAREARKLQVDLDNFKQKGGTSQRLLAASPRRSSAVRSIAAQQQARTLSRITSFAAGFALV